MQIVYLLDTDHMSILQRGGTAALPLTLRLSILADRQIATSIVSYEEQCKGWLAKTARARDDALLRAYVQLGQHLEIYAGINVLPYDVRAHTIFQSLRGQRVRTGTQDLKIAAIALANDATILTRNTTDFSRVTNLKFEDWSM